ncbi:MAG: hypothetical protein JNM18_26815 [Planctomycetaceae bacterium]|nr:hypothetical protein [Planctomycetaceae bacterium]
MSTDLAPHIEQKIAAAVASGLFPSREAVIEAGVEQLLDSHIPRIPAEHRERVEAAILAANAGHVEPMSAEEWESLRQLVRDVAAGKAVSSE